MDAKQNITKAKPDLGALTPSSQEMDPAYCTAPGPAWQHVN